jgi:hypothetical protein
MNERDRLVEAVRARLERASITQDLDSVLEQAALVEARELAESLSGDPSDLPAMYVLGWLHWYRRLGLPAGQGQEEEELQAAVTWLAPCFVHGVIGLPEPLLPILAAQATGVSRELVGTLREPGIGCLCSRSFAAHCRCDAPRRP